MNEKGFGSSIIIVFYAPAWDANEDKAVAIGKSEYGSWVSIKATVHYKTQLHLMLCKITTNVLTA